MNKYMQVLRNMTIGPSSKKIDWAKHLQKQQALLKKSSRPVKTGMELVKAGRLLSKELHKRNSGQILPTLREIIRYFRGR